MIENFTRPPEDAELIHAAYRFGGLVTLAYLAEIASNILLAWLRAFGIAVRVAILIVALHSPVAAVTYWEDGFESPLSEDGFTPWDTSACAGFVPFPYENGCNPFRCPSSRPECPGSVLVHSGTHALFTQYGQACGMDETGQGCGAYYDHAIPPTQDLYMRWWHRQINEGYGTNNWVGNKQFYNQAVGHEIFWTSWPDGSCAGTFNCTYGHLGAQTVHDNFFATCTQSDSPNTGCNHFPNQGVNINIHDGQWHCLETHVNVGTPGLVNGNGTVEAWVDGILVMRHTNVAVARNFPGDNNNYTNIRPFAQQGGGKRWIDDLAAGNTRIGCSGLPQQPPPSVPSNFRFASIIGTLIALAAACGLRATVA